MSQQSDIAATPAALAIADCWNSIGVHGDASCRKLAHHIHCRNCPVYSAGAANLLDVEPPADYIAHWTEQVSKEKGLSERATNSVLIFRIGVEWLALPTTALTEIASLRAIHSIPHRRNGVVLGLANIRGELLVCFSLRDILSVEPTVHSEDEKQRTVKGRLLVIHCDGHRAVCPVDEVHGVQRFFPRDLSPVPATVARATATYTKCVLSWQEKTIGLLDDQLLLHVVNRSVA
jgi:chemotaxis-related protein WspD